MIKDPSPYVLYVLHGRPYRPPSPPPPSREGFSIKSQHRDPGRESTWPQDPGLVQKSSAAQAGTWSKEEEGMCPVPSNSSEKPLWLCSPLLPSRAHKSRGGNFPRGSHQAFSPLLRARHLASPLTSRFPRSHGSVQEGEQNFLVGTVTHLLLAHLHPQRGNALGHTTSRLLSPMSIFSQSSLLERRY